MKTITQADSINPNSHPNIYIVDINVDMIEDMLNNEIKLIYMFWVVNISIMNEKMKLKRIPVAAFLMI